MAKIDERVSRVESLVRAQSGRLHDRQFSQVGVLYSGTSRSQPRLATGEGAPTSPEPSRAAMQDSIGLRVRPHSTLCRPACPRSCHTPQRSASPSALNSILGRLFVGYSRLPAIKCNSHNTLRLLLDRWSEYTVCPRLHGPHLLEIAALYAECETLGILADAKHLRSKRDNDYTLADFKALLRGRVDVAEKLVVTFEKLLAVLNMAPAPAGGREGLLSRLSPWSRGDDELYVEREDDNFGGSDDWMMISKMPWRRMRSGRVG